MVDAAPFAALRYDPAVAGDAASTSAPAYDDLERFTYASHRAASPYTVLELLTGEDDGTANAYRGAGAAFQRWLRTGVLRSDAQPAYYLYEIHELRSGVPAVLRGVLAAVAVDDDSLLPHEAVDPDRVAARVRRLEVVPADLAPVFAVHTAAPQQLREIIDAEPTSRPIVAFTDEAGADHRVWPIREPAAIDTVRAGLAQVRAVIADGHHRYAAARARSRSVGASRRTLTYLVDGTAYGPELRAVHRMVEPAPTNLDTLLARDFEIVPVPFQALASAMTSRRALTFGLCTTGGNCRVLVARDEAQLRARLPGGHSPAWTSLDAAVWEHVVRPQVGGARVTYRSDARAAAAELAAGLGATLFVLCPPTLDDVFACAYAGEAMPAKTTWFRPKPRAGLVMRSLDSSE